MKLLIVSDTHGRHYELEQAIAKEKPFDMMLHLGDVDRKEREIYDMVACDVKIVSGNNDYFSDLPKECVFNIGPARFFMAHGHNHYVHMGVRDIKSAAKKKGANVVLFGHIHVPVLEEKGGIMMLCPGSIAWPRQKFREYTYAIMEVDELTGAVQAEICYL